MAETILIVDDEDSVRRTFQEWLAGADLGCEIVTAVDAESALRIASTRTIDVAILDWNLGAGADGLKLLEDLFLFNSDIVAIMVTGYAHQATPLDAMRMGVRDYFDKNQDLNPERLLASVRRQLDKIRPAKRERHLQKNLAQFRDSLEKVLPLVQTAAALTDPVPFTESVRSLFRFLLRSTGASDGVLVVRSYDSRRQPAEVYCAYNVEGQPLQQGLLPFSQSLASAVLSMQECCAIADLGRAPERFGVELQAFEKDRQSLLAVPLTVGPGTHVILELFDKQPPPFTDADSDLLDACSGFAAEMMKQALAERESRSMLLDAVAAALKASQEVADALKKPGPGAASPSDQSPPPSVLEQLRRSLEQSSLEHIDADQALQLAEIIRVIATRHGKEAAGHCIELLQSVDRLLRKVTS